MAKEQKTKFKETEIGKEKITNIFLSMRCVKKRLIYNGKEFNVFVIKDTPARAQLNDIIVDNLFFEKFNKSEQEAILYHEKYHQKLSTFFKKLFYIIRFFSLRKVRWQEEFDADNYSQKVVGKEAIKSFLKKAEVLYQKGKIAYDKNSHPSIDERIRGIT